MSAIKDKPFNAIGILSGTAGITWEMHLSAWIFALAVLGIRPLTNKIPLDKFYFMDAIDLETKDGKANFVTRWGDKAAGDFQRMTGGNEDDLGDNFESKKGKDLDKSSGKELQE